MEYINGRLIPYSLVVLLVIIAYEIFFHIENAVLNLVVQILDGMIVGIFVIDLIFLAIKAKTVKIFFQRHWLDLLAIFPFYFFFRTIGGVIRTFAATEELVIGQKILHESLEAEKEVAALAKSEKGVRVLRSGIRSIRILSKSGFLSTSSHQKKRKKTK